MRPLLLAFIMLGCVACGTMPDETIRVSRPAASAEPKIKTDFDPDAPLTPAELQRVVSLALRAGLPDVATVHTYFVGREVGDASHCILVKSHESVRNREIALTEVRIDSEAWRGNRGYYAKKGPPRKQPPRSTANDLHADGIFWVTRGAVKTRTLALFDFKGESTRIELSGGISLAYADRLVAACSAGTVRYRQERLKTYSPIESRLKPVMISSKSDGKTFILSYGFSSVECVFEDEGVTVTEVFSWVS